MPDPHWFTALFLLTSETADVDTSQENLFEINIVGQHSFPLNSFEKLSKWFQTFCADIFPFMKARGLFLTSESVRFHKRTS